MTELVQFGDLTPGHFATHAVWIGCHTADYGEPWYDETDEETFRPRIGELPADPSEGMLLVRAAAVLADGCRLDGFITPAFDEGDLGTLQPQVFVNDRLLSFWTGIIGSTEEERTAFYNALSKSPEQIFPIRVVAEPGLTTGIQSAEVQGFYKREGGGIKIEQ
jgi:hypothetical protein